MNFIKTFLVACFAIFSIISPILSATFQLQSVDGQLVRDKRDHGRGITGPVHTYVKTDKHANFKWGVRHHVGKHYVGH